MKVKLNVQERFAILGLMPQKGDILTAMTKVELEKDIGFGSEELQALNIQRLPDGRVQWNKEPVLFAISLETHEGDLNSRIISAGLHQEFENNAISLSDDAVVSKENYIRWLIKDGDETYIIKKQAEKLSVCQEPVKAVEISAGAYTLITDALFAQQKSNSLPLTETTIKLWEMFMKSTPDFGEEADKSAGKGMRLVEPEV